MEDLTKQQMVLLTVLVSFVCSVATSIMIVSLLTDTVAPTVTQTINRIVEKTIERVVTGTTTPIIVKPSVMPVVTESEKVMAAVQDNLGKLVVVRNKEKEGESATSTQKIGIGSVLSVDGIIAVDSSIVGEKTDFTIYSGDKYRRAKKVYSNNTLHVAFLLVEGVIKDDKNTEGIIFSPLSFASGDIKLGQPVVILGGDNGKSIIRETLTDIPNDKTLPLDTGTIIPASYKGGIVFNQEGKIIGFVLSGSEGKTQILHYSNVLTALGEYKNPKPEQVKP